MLNTETEQIWKLMRNWLLLVAGSIILMGITMPLIFYGDHIFVPKIVLQILAVIQFSVIIIATIFFIKLRKLKNSCWRTQNDRN